MESASSYVISASCISCGKCRKVCPVEAIWADLGNKYQIDPTVCMACGQCKEVCPVSAIANWDD